MCMYILSQTVMKARLCGPLFWDAACLDMSFIGVVPLSSLFDFWRYFSSCLCVCVRCAVYACLSATPPAPAMPPWLGRMYVFQQSWDDGGILLWELYVWERVCRCRDQGLCLLLFDLRLTECDPGSECWSHWASLYTIRVQACPGWQPA